MHYPSINAHFKERLSAKSASLTDFIINKIAKARKNAESEGEAHYLMTKAVLSGVTPAKNKNKLAYNFNNDAFWTLNDTLGKLSKSIPEHWKPHLIDEEMDQIKKDALQMMDATQRHYLYIFVRQDLVAEQQAVQATHATFVAGAAIAKDLEGNAARPRKFNPASTHFVLIGVPDLNALYEARGIAQANGITTHEFYEEDIGDQMTAFTTGIVTQEKRSVFRSYGLLKFDKEA